MRQMTRKLEEALRTTSIRGADLIDVARGSTSLRPLLLGLAAEMFVLEEERRLTLELLERDAHAEANAIPDPQPEIVGEPWFPESP